MLGNLYLRIALALVLRTETTWAKATTRTEASNRSTFVPLPEGLTLRSDTDYGWAVSIPGLGLNASSPCTRLAAASLSSDEMRSSAIDSASAGSASTS